ncbi:MAG TPA: hypothetical protein PK280_17600 [Planctomycetota bacterium]|nr:hypothetical protein [Planctomycetota bacterium]
MGLIDALRRPAVRIPALLALTVVGGALLARQCGRMIEGRRLSTLRHLRCIEVVTRAAREAAAAGRRPESLAELVGTPGKPGAIEELFLREYAALPEFSEPATGSAGSSPATAEVPGGARGQPDQPAGRRHPSPPAIQVRGPELLWEGYCYRLWPSPENERDFLVFAWPESADVGRLTSAFLSTHPVWLYYTYAPRFAGPGGGPAPTDMGEPFIGRIGLMIDSDAESDPERFMKRTEQSGGRLWARMELQGSAVRPAAETPPPPSSGRTAPAK